MFAAPDLGARDITRLIRLLTVLREVLAEDEAPRLHDHDVVWGLM